MKCSFSLALGLQSSNACGDISYPQNEHAVSLLSCNCFRTSPAPHPTSQIVLGEILFCFIIRAICFAFQGHSSTCPVGFFSRYSPEVSRSLHILLSLPSVSAYFTP